MEIIHIVLGKANPERMNGVNKVVHQLATRQSKAGLKVSVWGITATPEHNYGERNFTTRLFQKQRNPFRADEKLLEAILQKNYEAVFHLHGGWVPVFSSIANFMGHHRIKFVFTPHGAYNTIAMRRNALVKKMYFRFFEKSLLQNARHIHCIGQSEVSGLGGIYNNNKAALLPYGFECPQQPMPWLQTKTPFVFGFVGRLDIYTKGLDLLLNAFSRFHSQQPGAQLWIVGDGPGKARLMQLARRLHIREQVIFYGSRFGNEKNTLINGMHAFVHPSRNEGLPASVLEACSFGVPCIVSKATNVTEHVVKHQAGYSIQNDNVNELFEAMLKLYNASATGTYSAMRKGAMQLVKAEFDWDTLIPQFTKLYVA